MADIWYKIEGFNNGVFPSICEMHREIFRTLDYLYAHPDNKENKDELISLLRCTELLFCKGKCLAGWRSTFVEPTIPPEWQVEKTRQEASPESPHGLIFVEKYRMEALQVAMFAYIEDTNCKVVIFDEARDMLLHRLEHAFMSGWKMRHRREELPLVYEPRIRQFLKHGPEHYQNLKHIWTPPMSVYKNSDHMSDSETKYFLLGREGYSNYLSAHILLEREIKCHILKLFPNFESINLHESY